MSERIPVTTEDRPAPRPRSLGIKNLLPGLVERGKIKIGAKGAMRQSGQGNSFQPPQKLDHFLITSMRRGQDGNFLRDDAIHTKLGDKPTEIPVVLLYDDIELNFQTRYACYNGRTLWCSGDGETARRMKSPAQPGGNGQQPRAAEYGEVSCTCHRQAPDYTGKDKCKINGTLAVMIQNVDVIGGVWKLRTTSYNSVVGILSSLALIKRITGGPLAGIPLMLTLTPKSVTDPVQGNQQTVYVVGLEFRGQINALQQAGHQVLLERHQHNMRIEHIEQEAKLLIAHQPGQYAGPDDVEDELDEFYPEQRAGDAVIVAAPANDNQPQGSAADALNALAGDEEPATQAGPAIEQAAAPAVQQQAPARSRRTRQSQTIDQPAGDAQPPAQEQQQAKPDAQAGATITGPGDKDLF